MAVNLDISHLWGEVVAISGCARRIETMQAGSTAIQQIGNLRYTSKQNGG
jgi:hypothetical protein